MKTRRITSLVITLLIIIQMMPFNLMTAVALDDVNEQPEVAEEAELDGQPIVVDEQEAEEQSGAAMAEESSKTDDVVTEKEAKEAKNAVSGSKKSLSSTDEDTKEEASEVGSEEENESEEESDETTEEDQVDDADYIKKQGNEAADVQGDAAESRGLARKALLSDTSIKLKAVDNAVKELFDDGDGTEPSDGNQDQTNPDDPPRQGDGSNIEAITAKWITPDSVDNEDPALLYRKPERLEEQKVRLQINYALSGEHKYEPGDITITIPATIFKDRNGKDYGKIIIPYPEDPSKKSDFNWKQVGDKIVLTNTKRMSAATKGYIQFEFDNMYPQMLVDMETSAPFDAYIEVTTHLGNVIALRSNELTAQFDTEAIVTSVDKHSQSVTRVGAAQIPENQRVEGESEYIRVTWYVRGTTKANTYYTLDQLDSIPQAAVVESRKVVADGAVKDDTKEISLTDAQAINPEYQIGDTAVLQTEADVHGFVIGGDSSDSISLEKDSVFRGYTDGDGSYYTFSTAYPASQFQKDVVYTFHNNIRYTVTEVDPEVSENTNHNVQDVDPQKVTTVTDSAQVSWYFRDPKWINPTGHFMVHKNGNDDTEKGNVFHKSTKTNTDPHVNARSLNDGWYGIYPSAINELQDENKAHGEDGSIRLSYTINTVGYTMPWMYDGGLAEFREGEYPTRIIGNYNRPVTMTTTDTGVSIGRNSEKLTVFEDYTFNEIEFPNYPYVYKGRPQNINPDGSWTATTAGDGTFRYTSDSNRANWPDITLQIERNGEWEDFAVASWKSGNRVITLTDGTTLTDTGVVKVPEDTHNFRTVVTTKNTEGGEGATEAIQAAVDYDVRVVINLKSTEKMMELIDQAFENTKLPQMDVWNSTNMLAVRSDEPVDSNDYEIVSINKDGYDSIRGYTTDTAVYPHKTATQNLREVDYENRKILIHYTGSVEIQSIIYEKKTWQEAVDEGRLVADRHGFWRDLLPKGVTPDLSTIKVRSGDTVVDAYTVEDYQGSGRTLLVVEVDLTPTPQQYRSGDMYYYEDVPKITFDAIYDFESLKDYGYSIHNVISFESSNDHLGTIKNYTGEPDDPFYINPDTGKNNNIATERAFKDNTEKNLMKDLNPDNDNPSYVYAGVTTNINILNAARTSLYKDIQVNNDGIWSDGTYYRDIYGEEVEATEGGRMRTVYEGGQYSYRLRVMSDPDTVSTGMVILDSLENFHAKWNHDDPNESDNDKIDFNAERWQGRLRSVDTSQLEEMGCDPVLYYSLVENLQLSDEENPDVAITTNVDLTNTDVWIKASDYTGDIGDVKAVAIDCRKARDDAPQLNRDNNGFFRLQPLQSAVVILRMQAPSGDEARDIISRKGEWGASAQAYNNAYLLATSLNEEDADDIDYDPDDPSMGFSFVRKDYTKVGMKEYSVKASKTWNDDNDRDGKRPDTLTFTLYADGEVVEDSDGNPVTQVMNVAEGESEVSFEHIPYTDPDGNKIHYTVKEEEIEGYEASESQIDEADYKFINKHVPEKIDLAGTKTWEGDEEDTSSRPEKIDVVLYANGAEYKRITVEPDSEGNWRYEFNDLFKYADGEEIKYEIKEAKAAGTGNALDSYITEVDGMDIGNEYHPFGELEVYKRIEGTTEISAEQEFTFTFAFSEETTNSDGQKEDAPIFDEFDYEILDEYGEPVTGDDGEPLTGKITSNGEIKIKGGQMIHVKDIPEYVKYSVSEGEVDGFTLTGKTGDSGTVAPNETAVARFTNTYNANGQINLGAVKRLENRILNKYQFRFELYEVIEDDGSGSDENPSGDDQSDPSAGTVGEDDGEDDGASDGEIIRGSASSDVVSNTVLRPDGTVDYSLAPVTFGVLRYTQEDHGKTFTYRIKEIDLNRAGYEYTKDVYEVKVEVTDNGDGTLSVVPTYYDPDGKVVKDAEFVNTYTAKGDTTLNAWKSLPGRDLTDDEFEFELLDVNGDPIKDENNEPVTVKNSSNGTVVFDPAEIDALNYDEKDIGKTFYYAIREKEGEDPTVRYDKTVFGYQVKIVDNGDGTLYGEQTLATPTVDQSTGKITGWTTELAELPVFVNELEDGGFSISKSVTSDPEYEGFYDPNQLFLFKVKLIGDDVTDDLITEYTLTDRDGGIVTKSVEMADGEFQLSLKDGDKASFGDIPAGIVYQVFEDTPSGWVLEEQENASGTIQPNENPEASFLNRFEPGSVSVQFTGVKMLDYKPAPAGRFQFKLREVTPGREQDIEIVEVLDGGFIQFKPLIYHWDWDWDDVRKYTIEEVDPEDDTVDWDRHIEKITVTIHRDEELEIPIASVEYESDGDNVIKFTNMTRPGNLKLTKKAEGTTDANKDDEFTFKITLSNADGMPLGKDDKIYWYTEKNDDAASDGSQNSSSQTEQNSEPSHKALSFKSTSSTNLLASGNKKQLLASDGISLLAVEKELYNSTSTGNLSETVKWSLYKDGSLVIEPIDGVSGSFVGMGETRSSAPYDYDGTRFPWHTYRNVITSVQVTGKVAVTGSCWAMFRKCPNLVNVDVLNLDTSGVTNFRSIFYECTSLEYLNLGTWKNTGTPSGYEPHNWMFGYNPNLKYVDISSMSVLRGTTTSVFNNTSSLTVLVLGSDFAPNSSLGLTDNWSRLNNPDPSSPISSSSMTSRRGDAVAGVWMKSGASIDFDYQVKYDANGGTGDPEVVTENISNTITLPNAADVGIYNEDLGFAGWANTPDAIFPDYQEGDLYRGTPGTTTTLYAVWIGENSFLVHFDANGGFSPTQWKRANSLDEAIELPEPTNPGNIFNGWNSEQDGSGDSYEGTITGEQLGVEPGQTVNLYAQWLNENDYAKYTVEHYRQNSGGDGYSLYEMERPTGKRGESVSPEEKEYEGYIINETDHAHADSYVVPAVGQPELVIKYYYDLLTYNVVFDGNGATSGQMTEPQEMLGGKQYTLYTNGYQKKGSIFTGWNTEPDGSGTQYVDQQKVKNMTKENGATVTLYAQWLDNSDSELEPTNGVIIVKCKAGETIVIPDLPNGTTYTIEEIDNPSGWTQKGEVEGNGGTIEANVTKYASVTNEYKSTGEAFLSAHKTLEGETLEEDQFTFQLLDSDKKVIETVTNGAIDDDEQVDNADGELVNNPYYNTSIVKFSELDYDESDIGKTYTYYIREVIDSDDVRYQFDDSEIEVNVAVSDGGHGVLLTEVTYKDPVTGQFTSGEYIFKNEMSKSELEIKKNIDEHSDEYPGGEDVFEFVLTLTDKDGNVLEGEFDAVKGEDDLNVSSGDTITLNGGEKITISGLPHGTSYKVEEQEKENWEQTAATGDEGELKPGELSAASFINKYHKPPERVYTAEGDVELVAKKEVEGGPITEDDEFTFELMDENGDTIQSKPCDKVSSDSESVSESTITFDKIHYDLSDLDYPADKLMEAENAAMEFINGKETEYNQIKADAQAEYKAAKSEFDEEHKDDDPIPEFMSFDDWFKETHDGESFPEFNTWFKAQEDTGEMTPPEYLLNAVEEAKLLNPREGTFTYFVREVKGDDPDVNYDTKRYYYKVKVVDNGDGELETEVSMWKLGKEDDEEIDEIKFVNTKTTQIRVYKRWTDNNDQDGYRPSKDDFVEKLHLMNGSEEVKDVTPLIREDEDGNLTIIYTNLPAFDGEGNKIIYTVKEDGVDHYAAQDGKDEVVDGETLMNVHAPEKTEISVEKLWDDLDNLYDHRKDAKATVQLYSQVEGGEKKAVRDPVEVGTEDGWSYTWKNLPVYENKKPVTYSVEETMGNPRYYTSEVGDMDEGTVQITNTITVTELELTKKMSERVSGEGKNQTVVFDVKGTDPETGETIYENTVGISFNDGTGESETKILYDVPKNAKITVTEAYTGNYEPVESKITKTELEEVDGKMIWVFEFENEHEGDNGFGDGIVNAYRYTQDGVEYVDPNEATPK